jgi:hypothetical protein
MNAIKEVASKSSSSKVVNPLKRGGFYYYFLQVKYTSFLLLFTSLLLCEKHNFYTTLHNFTTFRQRFNHRMETLPGVYSLNGICSDQAKYKNGWNLSKIAKNPTYPTWKPWAKVGRTPVLFGAQEWLQVNKRCILNSGVSMAKSAALTKRAGNLNKTDALYPCEGETNLYSLIGAIIVNLLINKAILLITILNLTMLSSDNTTRKHKTLYKQAGAMAYLCNSGGNAWYFEVTNGS